ncbi:MAG: hypothetical protein JNG89_10565 [Planctomycetaceae bacterium]|nr:hypothetical protein [Planctomycetaceae bacterium]
MLRITLAIAAFLGVVGIGSASGFADDAYPGEGHSTGGSIQQAGYYAEEDPGQNLSAWECFWEDFRECVRARRLTGYKRVQRKHRKFLYPEYSVACSPTFGYHHTQWRQFPDCDYVWTSQPQAAAWPTPATAAPPAVLSPMLETAPEESATTPPPAQYFPEPVPQLTPVQPEISPAPPAEPPLESGAAYQPVQSDSLIEFIALPRSE